MNRLKLLFFINLSLIAIELWVVLLCWLEILALDYDWDGKMNRMFLLGMGLIQLVLHYLIYKVESHDKKIRMLFGQLVLFGLVALWILWKAEVHYKMLR